MKVLLVEPYDRLKSHHTFRAPSLGVWRIYGFLKRHGIECSVFSPCFYANPYDALQRLLDRYKPTLIGFSITSLTLPYDLSLIRWARLRRPNAVIIGGGIEATFESEYLLSFPYLDYCIIGEGEIPMVGLCEALKNGGRIDESTPGLVFRKSGKIVKNPNKAMDYETFKSATFDVPYGEMPIGAYWKEMLDVLDAQGTLPEDRELRVREIKSVRIMTTNYCPLKCAFCSYTNFLDFANNGCRTKVVRLTQEDIIMLISKILKCYPETKTIIFQDDLFVFKRDSRILDLCERIISGKTNGTIPRDLSFIASCRIDVMDRTYLRSMQKAGFRLIGYGVESFSRKTLCEYDKEAIYEKVEKVLDQTIETGITPFLDIILVSPDSRFADIVDTLRKCIKYLGKGCEISIYPTVIPFAGSQMSQDPRLKSLIHYRNVKVPRMRATIRRGISIQPRQKRLRCFLSDIGNATEKHIKDLKNHYGIKYFPSRFRSLLLILSAIERHPRLFHGSKEMIQTKIFSMIGKNSENIA
jgi:radical SAM superfamily enzyme YgiQ (UPF0313 family)